MLEQRKQYYTEKYGEDNADFLYEQDMAWSKNYKYSGFIKSPVYHSDKYFKEAQTIAKNQHWDFFDVDGNVRLIQNLVDGVWNENEFLKCPVQHRIEASFDESKIKAVPV
jgi:hypothetical protein